MTEQVHREAASSAVPNGGGARLRREREARGLSVADIASHMKIGPKRVEAIEAGQWESLLPLPYLRGFVRHYAKLVQLEADPILDEIDQALGRTPDQSPTSLLPARQLDAPFFDRPGARFGGHGGHGGHGGRMMAIGIVVLVLIGVAVWLGSGGFTRGVEQARSWWAGLDNVVQGDARKDDPIQRAVPTPAPAGPERPAADGRVEQALPAPISYPLPADVRPSALEPVAAAEVKSGSSAPIVLRFADESWVEVRQGDGKVLLSQLNRPNTEKVLTGREPFEFIIGNPKGVSLTFRGVAVDLAPYVRENVARVTLR